jgi:hypothetical protein
VPNFRAGIGRLNLAERTYLKHLITPEAAFLMAKAFGPEMGMLLWPFIAEDEAAELPDTVSSRCTGRLARQSGKLKPLVFIRAS